ncbi:MAG TPA: sodium/glutamate symporter [Bryobacteraceae bacterium]|nr:sodium/glutamate symporter [Bryobacteraceae bacterium]
MSPVLTLKLNVVQVLALAAFGLVMGVWIKRFVPALERLNIPASIVGGLVYALLALFLRDRWLNLEMDMVLRDILMVAFFTTIGMSASLRLVREGGVQVVVFFAIATAGAVLQNVLGIALASVFGLDPLLGVVSGSVALTGGPATALAFGKTFEQMGVIGATTLGIASATFGITAGGLLGGHIGGSLIRRYDLLPVRTPAQVTTVRVQSEAENDLESESSALMQSAIAIAIAMGLGTLISSLFERAGAILPAYVGAMIAAAILRNIDDWWDFFRLSQEHVNHIGTISLNVFIVMALLTLRLWELVHLAVPMILMLAAQVALVWAMCVLLCYRLMGRDYESAVMAGGFCGFMLGTTANAMACMGVLTEKYGPSPRAFIVVPLVGAFLIDFTNALIITAAANLLR